ncbi:hypothetical protein HPB51_006408 [Rhipicephalus microplus]|uniref:Uncharacterized protein n=1 Tax=Rhipicephalus microplus TaxID=6941 RepID=A0A9J6EZ25_RHIMP|nr:hypothetical protein HPB51_006408 [Rhipicephalus microplus]
MRQLLGVHARQDGQLPLLRELFLQRLPQSVRVVLAGSNETSLDRLAQLADRITEYSTPTFVPIAAARTHEQPDRLSRLEEKLQHLTETMQKLVLSGAPQQDEQRRNRSPSRRPSSSQRRQARDTQDGGVLFASGFVWRTVIALALFIFLITSRREGPIEEIMTLVRGCVQVCHRVQRK